MAYLPNQANSVNLSVSYGSDPTGVLRGCMAGKPSTQWGTSTLPRVSAPPPHLVLPVSSLWCFLFSAQVWLPRRRLVLCLQMTRLLTPAFLRGTRLSQLWYYSLDSLSLAHWLLSLPLLQFPRFQPPFWAPGTEGVINKYQGREGMKEKVGGGRKEYSQGGC